MRRRILLADDSVTIQKVIELTFLDEDYEVKAVSNGDEAIAALPQVNPDFVIADVHMPGANGYEVCRRSKEIQPDVPVLLLVGTFEPFDEGQSRASGADSFLKKPFDSQELLQRVEELLAARSSPPSAAVPSTASTAGGDLLAMPSLTDLPPLDLEPSRTEDAAPATDWGSFEVEPPPLPVPDPLPAPTVFPLAEDRPFDFRGGESSFEEAPFSLDEEPAAPSAPAVDESSFLPAGEPLFDLDAPAAFEPPPFETPSFEEPSYPSFETPSYEPPSFEPPATPSQTLRIETSAFQVSGFPTTPEEPPPSSIEASHEPEPTAPAVAPVAAAPVPVNGGGRLSDEDVDRIARRVVELMADRAIRDVAWEIMPDMAEVVIRDRLRELESQAETFE